MPNLLSKNSEFSKEKNSFELEFISLIKTGLESAEICNCSGIFQGEMLPNVTKTCAMCSYYVVCKCR